MKPFYEFNDKVFKEELWGEYIIPVAKWFMIDDKTSGYLMPQISGSIWECSLALDFLLRVYLNNKDAELNRLIEAKAVNTTRWLLTSLKDDQEGGMSWDEAPWDTAVALRSVLDCFKQFESFFSNDEKARCNDCALKVTKWLILQGKNWKSPSGYLTADSTDLAVILSVLIKVKKQYPDERFKENDLDIDSAIIAIVKMLLQCAQADSHNEDSLNLDSWGSLANIGEVVCGLSSFVSDYVGEDTETVDNVRFAILSGLKHIEKMQNNGGITDNSVADSCAVLWSYLSATKTVMEYNHDDIMVFKSLCWMCDSNKVLDDGSFLHSSYVTVFYALALIETYETWELGSKPTNEVYHVVVWLNPNIETTERAKRLDLELKNKTHEETINSLKETISNYRVNFYTGLITVGLIILTLIIMQLSSALSIFTFKMGDVTIFSSIVGVATVIIPSAAKISYELLKKKNPETIIKKKRTKKRKRK